MSRGESSIGSHRASRQTADPAAPYPQPQAPPQSHPQYEQEMPPPPPPQPHPHASYITNAYISYYTHAHSPREYSCVVACALPR